MKPTPPGWPRISTAIYYPNGKEAIDWLCRAFGFELQLLVEGDHGSVEHSQLTFGGEGMIMVGEPKGERMAISRHPGQVDGVNTQNLMVYVDDVEAHFERARAAGATITQELETHDYGPDHFADRGYGCRDIGGHHWWFFQRLRTLGKDAP